MRLSFRLLVPVCSLALGAAVVGLQGGCGSSETPVPTTVRGRVTFQGQPLAGGLVVFSPDAERGGSGKPMRAEIRDDGSFELTAESKPDVPPGWYRVAIAPAPASGSQIQPLLPLQLRRPDQSGLVREVAAGKDHHFEFAIESTTGN
jgi:hypothetical protein